MNVRQDKPERFSAPIEENDASLLNQWGFPLELGPKSAFHTHFCSSQRGRSTRGRTQKYANARKRAQMSAKERKHKSAKERKFKGRKRVQKGAKERFCAKIANNQV